MNTRKNSRHVYFCLATTLALAICFTFVRTRLFGAPDGGDSQISAILLFGHLAAIGLGTLACWGVGARISVLVGSALAVVSTSIAVVSPTSALVVIAFVIAANGLALPAVCVHLARAVADSAWHSRIGTFALFFFAFNVAGFIAWMGTLTLPPVFMAGGITLLAATGAAGLALRSPGPQHTTRI